MEVHFAVTCDGCDGAEKRLQHVLLFETRDPQRVCLISHESIHETYVDFCPEATLISPFEQYNGVRLPCGHEFHAVSLFWSWSLNFMVCPCCRSGEHKETYVDLSSCINIKFLDVFRLRRSGIRKSDVEDEHLSLLQQHASEHEWYGMFVIVYYHTSTQNTYHTVMPLHQNTRDGVTDFGFAVQRAVLRQMSGSLFDDAVYSMRFALVFTNEFETHTVARSQEIRFTDVASAVAHAHAGVQHMPVQVQAERGEVDRDLADVHALHEAEQAANVLSSSSSAGGDVTPIHRQGPFVQRFSPAAAMGYAVLESYRMQGMNSTLYDIEIHTHADVGAFHMSVETSDVDSALNAMTVFSWKPSQHHLQRVFSSIHQRQLVST